MNKSKIPSKMRVIQLEKQNEDVKKAIANLSVVTKSVPKPKHGQVLVKIEAAPCNPSDLLFLQGKYGVTKTLPAVPGWEGAGTVVATGGGLRGMWLNGQRVACGGQTDKDGTWAEYFIADAGACVPLKTNISFEEGATLLINPLTAVGLVQDAKDQEHSAIIQTAAASQVGRMVIKLAAEAGIPTINIVRREELVDELMEHGAEVVINSEDDGFLDTLEKEAKRLSATIAFEAVAGEMTSKVLNAMPRNSTVVVYGSLSERLCDKISPVELIFGEKKIEGFWLTGWFKRNGFWRAYKAIRHVQKMIVTGKFETHVQRRCDFDDFKEGLLEYHKNMSAGKVLLEPGLS